MTALIFLFMLINFADKMVIGLAAIGWTTMHPTHSTRELARVLQRERVADEPVLMIERYAYDLPLYARLAEGVSVGDDWSDASIQQHDNWRNELADAGTFAPLLAAQRLISLAELDARLCAAPVSWVVAALDAPNRFPVMAQATRVATTHEAALWRVERGTTIGPAAKCPASADRGAAPR